MRIAGIMPTDRAHTRSVTPTTWHDGRYRGAVRPHHACAIAASAGGVLGVTPLFVLPPFWRAMGPLLGAPSV